MIDWLKSLDPTLLEHLNNQGIASQTVEQKYRESCLLPFAHRHRINVPNGEDHGSPRFHLRVDIDVLS